MIKIDKKDIEIDLNNTITCGQIFRFEVIDNKYLLILKDRIVELYEDNDYIYVESNNEDNLKNVIYEYLDLNRNYSLINKAILKNDPSLKEVIDLSKGFKIIQQYPLETMISYIISANNSVRNIQKAVNLLSEQFGRTITYKNKSYRLFPTLEELRKVSIEDLNNVKIGFRSKYIYEFVNTITDEKINNIYKMNTEEAIDYLMSFKGIGLKVASCILMFSYSRFDVFPIDTWVKKYMNDIYGLNDVTTIKKYALEKFGDNSGLVLQYFFNAKRNKQN